MLVSPKESLRIQEFLIKKGYCWNPQHYDRRWGSGDDIMNIYSSFFYFNNGFISCGDDGDIFQYYKKTQLTCEEFFELYDQKGQRKKKLKKLKDKEQENRFEEFLKEYIKKKKNENT